MAKGSRGSYPKGIAKRKEILDAALHIIAVDGFNHTTLAKISQAVQISEAGVLHYFHSLDDLLVEVLKERDIQDVMNYGNTEIPSVDMFDKVVDRDWDPVKLINDITKKNMLTPGLVELYAHMSVKASDQSNPAYTYFTERGQFERKMVGHLVEQYSEVHKSQPAVSVEHIARIMQAILDGLQIQWLVDNTLDMDQIAAEAFDMLSISIKKSETTKD
ncbi:TetR/AcrR family transcriptional regulator [Bifidobacterium sp.]|jgi:AcrR family transcriptional regulator|uniref:TetR/AcrR family transcriptional regulator n=1 Tax=Bifidobacterium sp. TaxID=41200 RepID=UPI0025BB7F43|nr:TetR/AcrR family transcriptional regulator [Bifidobacterium sp.]MCI1635692.1 TetR/AcrR family transcriptional regulator [Bifidobacterium sp.]